MFSSKIACSSAALASLGILAIPVSAAAQDSPFNGFYVGANAGVTWSDSSADAAISTVGSPPTVNPPINPPEITAINAATHFDSKHHTGFTGGIEAGYNYVMDSGFMVGVETDLNIYDITGGHSNNIPGVNRSYTVSQSVDTDFIWNVRPRIGYAMDNILVFASGGLAITSTQYKAAYTDSAVPGSAIELKSNDNGKTGWTVGGGAAYAFTDKLSLKGEYLYTDFGNSDFSATSANGFVAFDATAHLKSHMFRAGVDYRF